MKCTEKWFKQQIHKTKNSIQTKLKRHQDPTNYWRGYFEGYLKCVDDVLGLFVEREKELREKIAKINSQIIGGMASEAYSEGKRDAYQEIWGRNLNEVCFYET